MTQHAAAVTVVLVRVNTRRPGNMICRVALLRQHQLRGQCEVAVIPAAAAVAATAVPVPQVEVSLLTPAGLEVNI